ncbi:hypothetical protein GF380_03185 [Candidatus Uhrbacteria bacterium]|nr:hypothetical protein [Candidatus Uhrbacteria bacterium]MBD3284146.1 hypothetical protein [Candidatus Uhrbacteria bacterium]
MKHESWESPAESRTDLIVRAMKQRPLSVMELDIRMLFLDMDWSEFRTQLRAWSKQIDPE